MDRAVFFDLFGTLVKIPKEPEPRLIRELSLTHSYKEIEKALCETVFDNERSYIDRFLKAFGLDLSNSKLVRGILFEIADSATASPHSKESLEELKRRGYKIGIISNSFYLTKEIVLPKVFSGLYLEPDLLYLSHERGRLKCREVYEICLREIGVNSTNTIIVGNSLEDDIIKAKEARIKGILVSDEIESEEPLVTIPSLRPLVAVVDAYFS